MGCAGMDVEWAILPAFYVQVVREGLPDQGAVCIVVASRDEIGGINFVAIVFEIKSMTRA
eukprot:SAG11_NODE_151_length_14583_cov_21.306200_6_plen_60_part_00